MTIIVVASLLIAVVALAGYAYKAGECDALHLELAVMRRSAENWADAYYDAIRSEDSDGEDA